MRTYQGSFITKSPITPAGPYQCGAASGVWTIDQMVGWQKAGLWPIAGNSFIGAVGIFALGYANPVSKVRNKYLFSSDVNSVATSSNSVSNGGAAAGNSTAGIFALGIVSNKREKYTYSNCAVVSATASGCNSFGGTAAGNSTVGIFSLGTSNGSICGALTTREKYTYSGCSVSSATAASTAVSYTHLTLPTNREV